MDYLPTKKFTYIACCVTAAFAVWYVLFVRPNGVKEKIVYTQGPIEMQIGSQTKTETGTVPLSPDQKMVLERVYLKLEPEIIMDDIPVATENESSTDETIREYGLAIVKALAPITSVPRENELGLMLTSLEKGTAELAKKEIASLTKSATAYRTASKNLKAITVPPEVLYAHTDLLNRVTNLAQMILNMSQVLLNPTLAISSGKVYSDESTNLFKAIQNINTIFDERGITFTSAEKANVVLYEAQTN